MFQIPSAPKGMSISWKGHFYGRNGESIGALKMVEIEEIRQQNDKLDWSAQICEGVTLEDLDREAILRAREQLKIENPKLSDEYNKWDDITF